MLTENEILNLARWQVRLTKIFNKTWNPQNVGAMVARDKMTEKQAKFIVEIHNIIKDVAPDNSDLQVDLAYTTKTFTNQYGSNHAREIEMFDHFYISKLYIVLRYPEFEISNSKRESIIIKDLFVRIPISLPDHYTKPNFHTIEGTRATVSIEEFTSQYAHSHLKAREYNSSSFEPGDYFQFCTGDADINSNKLLLNSDYDADLVRLMILQVGTLISHESLSGTPYKHLNTVALKQKDYHKADTETCNLMYKRIINKMRFEDIRPDFDWEFFDGKYRIKDNEKFEDFFRKLLPNYHSAGDWFLFKDENGEYFMERAVNARHIGVKQDKTIIFQGRKIPFTVYGEIRQTYQKTKYINPEIKNYVKQRFEFKANLLQTIKARIGG